MRIAHREKVVWETSEVEGGRKTWAKMLTVASSLKILQLWKMDSILKGSSWLCVSVYSFSLRQVWGLVEEAAISDGCPWCPWWARMGGWRLHKGKTQDVYPLPRSCLTKHFTNLTHLVNTLNLNKHLSIAHTLKSLMDSCWLIFKYWNIAKNICFWFINHHPIPKRKERSEILWKRVTHSDYREVSNSGLWLTTSHEEWGTRRLFLLAAMGKQYCYHSSYAYRPDSRLNWRLMIWAWDSQTSS